MTHPSIESTDEWTIAHLAKLVAEREDAASFHIFSEQNIRSEVFNLRPGERISPICYDGNVLLIPILGSINVSLNGSERKIEVGSQLMVNPSVELLVSADENSSVQLFWTPPFANNRAPRETS